MKCIWCKTENNDSAVEHIFPEAIGCPTEFVLTGGRVCQKCNNGLAHLDQAVSADFDLSTFMANVPGKKGKSPTISTRGNMLGVVGTNGAEMHVNLERFSVKTSSGSVLGAYGKSRRNITGSFTLNGPFAEVKLNTTIGGGPKFVRGIYKIGLSSLTYFLGEEIAQSPAFDPVREFVREGVGNRRVILMKSENPEFRNEAWAPKIYPSGYVSFFRLVFLEFGVDLSADHSLFPIMRAKASEALKSGTWSWLPPDPTSSVA